jgi:hypothetical protein
VSKSGNIEISGFFIQALPAAKLLFPSSLSFRYCVIFSAALKKKATSQVYS